jgi:hypothetical protein
MKNIIAFCLLVVFSTSALAFDSAEGIGQWKSKVEIDASTSGQRAFYDLGLTDDWTIYTGLHVMPYQGMLGLGFGTKYAILNEIRNHIFSLAPQVEAVIGPWKTFTIPGLTVSKKVGSRVALVGKYQTWTTDVLLYSSSYTATSYSLDLGAVVNIIRGLQVSAFMGNFYYDSPYYKFLGLSATVAVNYAF